MSGAMTGGSRYGGFGSEDASFGGYSGGTYGDGGGFGGNSDSGFQDSGATGSNSTNRRDRFEEYDEDDDGAAITPASSRRKAESAISSSAKMKAEVKKLPEVDLFEFGDDQIPPMTPPKPAASNGLQSITTSLSSGNALADEDDFDDFISATPTAQTSSSSRPPIAGLQPLPPSSSRAPTAQFTAPKPVSATQGASLDDPVGFSSISPAPSNPTLTSTSSSVSSLPSTLAQSAVPQLQSQPPRPTGYQASQPNYFTSVPAASSSSSTTFSKPALTSTNSYGNSATKPAATGDVFGSLWSSASAGAGIKKSTPSSGPNLASMAKEKATAGIWGAGSSGTSSSAAGYAGQGQQRPAQTQSQPQRTGGGLDDLLG